MVGYFSVFVVCAVMGWFCCCDSGSITLGGIALGLDLLSIPDSVISADVWASHSVINGLIDAVLRRERIKSCNAFMAALVEEIFGMVNLLGNKFTASGILYYPVLGMNIFGNYNFPWLFRCTRQVHHVMPRRLCTHRWDLPVIHYHKIMVIYPYPFFVVISQLFSWIIFINDCIYI